MRLSALRAYLWVGTASGSERCIVNRLGDGSTLATARGTDSRAGMVRPDFKDRVSYAALHPFVTGPITRFKEKNH